MSDSTAIAVRRLRAIRDQLDPVKHSLSDVPRNRRVSPLQTLHVALPAKIALLGIFPSLVAVLICARFFPRALPVVSWLISLTGQSLGLLALKDFYEELRSNVGIRMTLSRHFLTYNLLSCGLVLLLRMGSIGTVHGKVDALLAALYCAGFGRMLYLTVLHNSQLRTEHMSRRELQAAGHRVDVPALGVWWLAVTMAAALWIRAYSATSGASTHLSLAACLAAAIGTFHAGWRASLTSTPDMTSLSGAQIFLTSTLLDAVVLAPQLTHSPTARAHAAVSVAAAYCVALNAARIMMRRKPQPSNELVDS